MTPIAAARRPRPFSKACVWLSGDAWVCSRTSTETLARAGSGHASGPQSAAGLAGGPDEVASRNAAAVRASDASDSVLKSPRAATALRLATLVSRHQDDFPKVAHHFSGSPRWARRSRKKYWARGSEPDAAIRDRRPGANAAKAPSALSGGNFRAASAAAAS